MNRDHLQGGRKPQMGGAPVPWGRLLNDELSPILGKYGELVETLEEKYGIANERVRYRVDEYKTIAEQLEQARSRSQRLREALSNEKKSGRRLQ